MCPRVELEPSLFHVAEILEFALNEKLRPALGLRAELVGEVNGLTAEELNDALSLVSGVLSDPDIIEMMNPAPVEVE